MVGRDGRVRVMDFGLARRDEERPVVDEGASLGALDVSRSEALSEPMTRAGAIMGTPAYMSPEQFRGVPTTPASDQFSFAVTLWELLYGARPFAGDSMMELVVAVHEDSPRVPGRTRGAPAWLRRVCVKALAVAPERRFESIDALLDTIERGRRRGRALRLVGVLGVLGAVAGGVQGVKLYETAQRRAACAALGEDEARAWTDETRGALRAAFLGTELSYAEDTAARVVDKIDAYLSEWRAAQHEVCLQATVRGELAPRLHEHARWCLEDRKRELDALVEEFSRRPAVTARKASSAVARLSTLEPCLDRARLQRLGPPPADGRELLRAVRAQLMEARALQMTGARERSLEEAERALSRALELDWTPLVARARLQLAASQERGGDLEQALAGYRAAYLEAARVGEVELAAAAASKLVYAVGYRSARLEDGLLWAELARVELARLEVDDSSPWQIQLHSSVGSSYFAAGEYERALEIFGENLERQLALYGEQHPVLVRGAHNMGAAHSMLGRYDKAREQFSRAVELGRKTYGASHPQVALEINSLGSILLLERSYSEAVEMFERALAVQEAAFGPEHPDLTSTLNNLAIARDYLGEFDGAKALYERVIAIRERALGPEHPSVANSLNNLAMLHQDAGEHERALALHTRALTIQEGAIKPEHPDLAYTLNGLGASKIALGRYDEARAHLERALEIRRAALGEQHLDYASTLELLARLSLGERDLEGARARYGQALAVREDALGSDSSEVARSLVGLAKVELAAGEMARAGTHAERAVAIFAAGEASGADIAAGEFVLAKALWPSSGERSRARALARRALERLDGVGDPGAAGVRRWLEERR